MVSMETTTTRNARPASITRSISFQGQEFLVIATPDIMGAPRRTFRAWVKIDDLAGHMVVSSLGRDVGFFGQVGSEHDAETFEHLPAGSVERCAAVDAKIRRRALEAQGVIRSAFPSVQFEEARVTDSALESDTLLDDGPYPALVQVDTGNGCPEMYRDQEARAYWGDHSRVLLDECIDSEANRATVTERHGLADGESFDLALNGELVRAHGLTVLAEDGSEVRP